MALTDASRLANFAAGIGTPGSAINIDNTADTLGVGTNTVLAGATLQVGTGVTIYGNSGIVSAVSFRGNSFFGDGSTLTGVGQTINLRTDTAVIAVAATIGSATTITADGINITGIVTASSDVRIGTATTITADGINITGIVTASSDVRIGTKSVATTGKAIAMAMVFG